MLRRQFGDVKIVQAHKDYYYHVKDALLIAILGNLCGLSDMKDIHRWAESTHVQESLRERMEIHYFHYY